jgi:molybdopterin synthase sulfur carrier subunit
LPVRAKNLRGVIKEMDRLYPGLGEHLVEETTVAIDGSIHETAYFQPICPGCEVLPPNSRGGLVQYDLPAAPGLVNGRVTLIKRAVDVDPVRRLRSPKRNLDALPAGQRHPMLHEHLLHQVRLP